MEPDPVLSPPVLADLAGLADLVHLHLGSEPLHPAAVERWVGALATADLPLVLTVHELRNPLEPSRAGTGTTRCSGSSPRRRPPCSP